MHHLHQESWQVPEDPGLGQPPNGSPTPPGPETCDEIMPDSLVTAEADFAPCQSSVRGAR